MKKNLFPAAAVLVALSACTAQTEFSPSSPGMSREPISQPATVHVVITGSQEADPSSKTVLAGNLKTVLWKPEDAIKVFCEGWTAPGRFISTNEADSVKVTFEGDVTLDPEAAGTEDYWAIYPYSETATFESGVIYSTLPDVQEAVGNTFADDLFVSAAHCSVVDDMHFYSVCSGFKFSLDREDITSVTFTARGGEPVAGDFTVVFDEEGLPIITPCGTISSVTLKAPDGRPFKTGIWYYIVLLPQELGEGFTLTFEGEDSEGNAIAPIKLSSTSPLTLTRSRFPKSALKIANNIDTDIETPEIRAFLEDPEIDELYTNDTGYTETKGSSISCSAEGITFRWAASGARTLYISETEDFALANSVAVGASSTTTPIYYNLVPGVTYYCRTVSASGTVIWETSFVPKGPFRALTVGGNARDLGGWETADGKVVKYGKVFRGAAPSSSSRGLLDLGVGVEMDLRGYPSTVGSPNASSPFGAELINRPVCQFMYGESSHEPGVSADDYQQAIREIIYCLKEGKGVYFHCIGGADRTGTLSYLILALLGVDEANLCKEYELTGGRTRDDDDKRPFKQLVFYLKSFNWYGEPNTGEFFELQTLQDMTTAWALTKHAEEGDGLGPFEPLSVEEILTLKELLLEGYDRSEETSPLLAGDFSLRSE